jgi:hypothetical protein
MSDVDDNNPNRAPWSKEGRINPAPYAPNDPPGQGTRPPAKTKSGIGCWIWGCLGVVVFMLIAIIGIGFGAYYFVTNQVANYTDTAPADVPVVELPPEELEALEARIESFTSEVRGTDKTASETTPDGETDGTAESTGPATEPVKELVLTANDINALIASNAELKGKLFVEIEEGRVRGKASFPADAFPGGKGRFFNADAEFSVSMQDGLIMIRLTDASVKGERLPEQLLDGFSRENLAKEMYANPENAEMLRKFDRIEVVDDTIVLRLKVEDVNNEAANEAANEEPREDIEQTEVEPQAVEAEVSSE